METPDLDQLEETVRQRGRYLAEFAASASPDELQKHLEDGQRVIEHLMRERAHLILELRRARDLQSTLYANSDIETGSIYG